MVRAPTVAPRPDVGQVLDLGARVDHGAVGDHRARRDLRDRLAGRVEERRDPGEGQVGVGRPEHRAPRGRLLVLPHDHRAGPGGREGRRVPAVREEGDVGRPGLLERHDPLDAQRAVPLDAAADPFRQLGEAEVHGTSYFVAGAAGAAFLASAFLAGAPVLPYLALYRRTSSFVMLARGRGHHEAGVLLLEHVGVALGRGDVLDDRLHLVEDDLHHLALAVLQVLLHLHVELLHLVDLALELHGLLALGVVGHDDHLLVEVVLHPLQLVLLVVEHLLLLVELLLEDVAGGLALVDLGDGLLEVDVADLELGGAGGLGDGDRQREGGEDGDGAHGLSSWFGQKKLPMVNWKSTGASM